MSSNIAKFIKNITYRIKLCNGRKIFRSYYGIYRNYNNIISFPGLDSSLSLQSRKQSLFARLENIIVTDVDPKTVHKKVGDSKSLIFFDD